MLIEIGNVEALFRYPVKSMGGEPLEVANLGWHGFEGDRRLAFRRMNDHSGFPWLAASQRAITVTMRDIRCSILNLDPDSARPAPETMKAVVRGNHNNAGIYGAVTRIGRLAVGQTIFLRAASE